MIENEMKQVLSKRINIVSATEIELRFCWYEEIRVFGQDMKKTIAYIDICSFDEFKALSEIFNDLSMRFKSEEFIECLKRNAKRFPLADVKNDINMAEQFI
jgi:uncharacterized protein (DUF934 family)